MAEPVSWTDLLTACVSDELSCMRLASHPGAVGPARLSGVDVQAGSLIVACFTTLSLAL